MSQALPESERVLKNRAAQSHLSILIERPHAVYDRIMPTIDLVTEIRAPIDICFNLARDIDLHIESTEGTGERAVAGVTTGLIGPGEQVTWEATHFGIRQRLTSRITAFRANQHFRDSQVRGAFQRFDHDHFFWTTENGTAMRDRFEYRSPLGVLGRCADVLFLRAYMTRLLRRRALVIKAAAEAVATR